MVNGPSNGCVQGMCNIANAVASTTGNQNGEYKRSIDKIASLSYIDPHNVEASDGVKPKIIRTDENAIKLHLMDYQKNIIESDWSTLIELILTLVTTLVSGTFNNFLGISSDTWRALFLILLLMSIYRLIRSCYKFYKLNGKNNTEIFIDKLKSGK
jgi:hypothetical protein